MKITKCALFLLGLVLVTGCDEEKERFSRYPSVGMPLYEFDDYVVQLSDDNPEVIYNAICNLGEDAKECGDMLWGEHGDSEPDPEDAAAVQNAYSGVCAQLNAKEPMIVAASLRFLQLFAEGHDEGSELIEPVCRINSDYPLVQYEQVELLKRLADDSTHLPGPLLRSLLNSESWIVSRSTYELIGLLPDEPLRKELVARYRAAGDEKERLLLLRALTTHAAPEEVELAKQEVLSAESTNITMMASALLRDNLNAPGVFDWFVDHYAQLIFEGNYPQEIFDLVFMVNGERRGETARLLLQKGHQPGHGFLSTLNLRMEEKPEEVPDDLLQIEQELLTVPDVAERWQAIRRETEEDKQRCVALQEELNPLKEEYFAKMKVVLTQHDIPDQVQKKYLNQLSPLNVKDMVWEAVAPEQRAHISVE